MQLSVCASSRHPVYVCVCASSRHPVCVCVHVCMCVCMCMWVCGYCARARHPVILCTCVHLPRCTHVKTNIKLWYWWGVWRSDECACASHNFPLIWGCFQDNVAPPFPAQLSFSLFCSPPACFPLPCSLHYVDLRWFLRRTLCNPFRLFFVFTTLLSAHLPLRLPFGVCGGTGLWRHRVHDLHRVI